MSNKSININTENQNGKKPIDFAENDKIKELFSNNHH